MLLHDSGWSEDSLLPTAVYDGDAYCLASGHESCLHFANPSAPQNYRRHIAARIGAHVSEIDIQAASPRPSDVAICGYPCRSVLAVTKSRDAPSEAGSFAVLLDLRPIHEAWGSAFAVGGVLDSATILLTISSTAPRGWHACLNVDVDVDGLSRVHAGQVVIASYAPTAESPMHNLPPDAPDSSSGREGGRDTHHNSAEEPEDPSGADDADYQSDNWRPYGGEVRVPFLLFSQEKWPEFVAPWMRLPNDIHGAIASVEQARDADEHRRRSRLVAVHPQPRWQQICLLALPTWQYPGTVILIDNRLVDGGLFAIQVPHFLLRDEVLRLAGVEDTPEHLVFSGDVPWPCLDGVRIPTHEGLLFTVCTDGNGPGYFPDVGQMLTPWWEWELSPNLPGDSRNISWILTDGIHYAVPVDSDTFALNSTAVAESLALPPGQFVLVPASPFIEDHAHSGHASSLVAVACRIEDYSADRPADKIPYLLDLRPILHRLGWAYALATCWPLDTLPPGEIEHCEIFTDGAFERGNSAWAFVVIGYIQQRPLFVGWARGTVVLPGTALWVGADGHSAINGERSALFWALAWSLQFGSNLPCRVFVDSLVALRQTSGVYGSAAASTFAHACRALAQAVDSLGGVSSVCFHHVRAHKGHPFNELADLLAGSYALPDAQIPADVARLSDWVQAECIDWLWLYIAATRDPHCWPALQQRSFIDHAQRTVPQVGGAQSTAFFYRQVPASNTLDCPSRLRSPDAPFMCVHNLTVVVPLSQAYRWFAYPASSWVLYDVDFGQSDSSPNIDVHQLSQAEAQPVLHSICGFNTFVNLKMAGILVSSAAGKAFHSSIRRKAAPFLDVAAGTFQIGGRAGQPVQIANQSVRIFQAECASAGVSCAIVFLDLKEAFHRVVRPLIVGGPLDDRHVSGVLQALNLPPDAYDRLQNYVRDTPIFADAGADVWTTGILSEVLADTWFTWGHDGGLATVRGGTRPGDNLADMLFSFLFAEVLQRIRSQLQALGHIFQYPWHSDWSCSLERVSAADTQLQGPSDVTWIDDLAIGSAWAAFRKHQKKVFTSRHPGRAISGTLHLLFPNVTSPLKVEPACNMHSTFRAEPCRLDFVGSLEVPRPVNAFATIEGHPAVLITTDLGCPGVCAVQSLILFVVVLIITVLLFIPHRVLLPCALRLHCCGDRWLVWWRSVRKAQGGSAKNLHHYTYKPSGLFGWHREEFMYVGEVDEKERPHGEGVWWDTSFHGECLRGEWFEGMPAGSWTSREYGTGAQFMQCAVGYVTSRGDCQQNALNKSSFLPHKESQLRYGIGYVEASFAGGFFPFLPSVEYHNEMDSVEDMVGRLVQSYHKRQAAEDPQLRVEVIPQESEASLFSGVKTTQVFVSFPEGENVGYIAESAVVERLRTPMRNSLEALVFIHGFNCDLATAMGRIAQTFSLGNMAPHIVPFVFSYAGGTELSYFQAKAHFKDYGSELAEFLRSLRGHFSEVHILTHSCGAEFLFTNWSSIAECFMPSRRNRPDVASSRGAAENNNSTKRPRWIPKHSRHFGTQDDLSLHMATLTMLNPDVELDTVKRLLPDIMHSAEHFTAYNSMSDASTQ
ncbi:hypothetical protein AK812_SmicGene14396 [Symbiodinium microadriaticum]|uniref:RNase H type-1 domain-containing protein n=1 Tax=Symbiodinium microadriaticum TaxID=2951 RepID=A0A1Q9E5M2_SYMMI|nr:hypothetical protein AK812_SmicGene14396 [Symbiodinium microadriaticum]